MYGGPGSVAAGRLPRRGSGRPGGTWRGVPGTSGSRQVGEILNRAQAAGTGMTYRAIAIRPRGPLMGAWASGDGQ